MKIKEILESLKERGLFRMIKDIERIEGKYIFIGGMKYLDLSSSNYLGYRDSQWMKEAAVEGIEKYGMGSGASRLVVGSADVYKELEEYIALEKKQEKALLFNSGYDANLGIISTLYGEGDVIYCDKLNHASIYDGIKMSGARMVRYQHNNMDDLERKIAKTRGEHKRALIVVDTVFSMDGDRAELKKLVELKNRYNITLMVDEAHGGGVLGDTGMGLAEEQGVLEDMDLNMGTFSKAYGSQGAYVAGKKEVIDYLINHCRSLIYTTSLPPAVINCNLKAMRTAHGEKEKREYVQALSDYVRMTAGALGVDTLDSETNIIPLVVGDNEKTLEVSQELLKRGMIIPAIRKPTVTTPRLRLSISVNHTKADIDQLMENLKEIL